MTLWVTRENENGQVQGHFRTIQRHFHQLLVDLSNYLIAQKLSYSLFALNLFGSGYFNSDALKSL